LLPHDPPNIVNAVILDYLTLYEGGLFLVFRIHIQEGFEGQRHFVIPRVLVQQVKNHPLLYTLFPTDIGWYPLARYHYRERLKGAPENILIYCTTGSGWARVHDSHFLITPGHALIIPSGVPHVYSASLDDPWSIHWFHFRGETASQFTQQLKPDQYMIPIHEKANKPISETFQECYDALSNDIALREIIFCALALHRTLAWIFFGNAAFQTDVKALPKTIETVLNYMHDHLNQRPSLTELADQAGLSVSHFSSVFKEHIGESPMDYFIHLKMQYACHLLATTKLSIKQVAFSLAYNDPYYFSRLFHKVIGLSPMSYRQQGIIP
jgi:AraC-like DNA-binding protein